MPRKGSRLATAGGFGGHRSGINNTEPGRETAWDFRAERTKKKAHVRPKEQGGSARNMKKLF